MGRRPEPDTAIAEAMKKQIRALNVQRQKQIVTATDRLVKMVADLNAQINSHDPSRLTADEMQQLAEIEKLARTIREKMTTPVTPPMPTDDPRIFRRRSY